MPEQRSLHWRATGALLRPNARRYSLLTIVVVVSSLLLLAGPVLLRALIDRAAEGAGTTELSVLAGLFLGSAVISQVLALTVAYLATSFAWRTANDLRLQLADHVLSLDHEFHRSHSPGELIQRVDGDVTSVSDFLAVVVVKLTGAVVLVVGVVAVVAVIDWRIGLGMAVYAFVAGLVVYVQRDSSVAEAAEEMSATARLLGGIEERLTASEDLRANGAGSYAVWRFVEDTVNYVKTLVARERAYLALFRNLQGAIVIGAVVSLVVGAIGVQRGFLTIGTAFLLYQYSQQIRRPLEDILHDMEVIQKANGAMSRVVRLLATRNLVVDAGTRSPEPGPLPVVFDRVSFDYGDGEPVLDGISFRVEAGRSVGLVGHTGSGKTTLSRLLVRLLDATDGEISLGGVPIKDIPMAELRRRIAVVPQSVELVNGTVRDNLTLFDATVAEADIDAALAKVGLDRFRGDAASTLLGSGGVVLSAGEGQLLALARVWLRDPDIVVLDEATARVDPATEARLEQAIASLFQGRSVFVIAHRLSTLQRVDEIVVVEHGRLVEHGERELLGNDANSRYRAMLEIGQEVESGSGVLG